MDLGNKIQQFLSDSAKTVSNYFGNAASAVGNEVQQIPHQLQQAAQPVINEVQQLPNQAQGFGQSLINSQPVQQSMIQAPPLQNFTDWLGTQAKNVGNAVSQSVQQAPQNFMHAVNTMPLTNIPSNIAPGWNQTLPQVAKDFSQGFTTDPITAGQDPRIGGGSPYSFGNFVGNDIGGISSLAKEVPQAGKAAINIGRGVINSAINTAGLAGINHIAGQDQSNTPQNLALPGALSFIVGAVGGEGGSQFDQAAKTVAKRFDPEAAAQVMDFVNHVQTQGANKPYEDSPIIHAIAQDVFGQQSATWGNQKLANVFDTVLQRAGQMPNKAGLGLSTDEVTHPGQVAPLDNTQPSATGTQPPVGGGTSASVKMMITKRDEANLGNLGYTPQDIYTMKPQEAGNILDNQIQKPSIKDQLTQTPEPPKMSQDAIARGVETPIKGSDISVSPQAQIRYKIANPEPLPWETPEYQQTNPQSPITPPEIAKNPFEGARESLPKDETNTIPNNNGEPIVVNKSQKNNPFDNVMNPIKNQPKDFQDATNAFDAGNKTAQVDANQINLKYKGLVDQLGITPKQEEALVHYSQNPSPSTIADLQGRGYPIDQALVDKAKPLLDFHAQTEADRLVRANESGIPTAERENHIYQTYHQSPEEIDQIIKDKGLDKTPGFTFHKAFPTFLAAQDKAGLLPKYSTFGQLSGTAEEQLGKAVAGRKYQNFLEQAGYIKPSTEAPHGYSPISSANFPRAQDGSIYAADPKTANVLNNIFGGTQQSPISKGLEGIGKASAKAQATILTTPGYSVHGFTMAQTGKDLATGIGQAVTGHPIQGLKTIATPVQSMVRAFIPGAAGDFEKANADSIRQMATEGIGYTGKFNYKTLQGNTAVKTSLLDGLKGVPHQLEEKTVGEPTFQKFMFQRRVSLFNQFRDALVSQGKPLDEAVHTAATQLKNYDGIVNDLGRSPDVKNFMKTMFFAPQYRESVMGSLINGLKGTANFTNQDYKYSRSLILGMGATYLAYNALNRQLNNGKNLWENPTGKEFELVIPQKDANGNPINDQYGSQRLTSIPWMSGITTVPRAIVGTIVALAKGDTNAAIQQAGGLFSSPIQTATQALSGVGHFGNKLFDPNKPLLPQQAGYVASNLLMPGSINTGLKYLADSNAGKNPSGTKALANILQLPVKEGTMPNTYLTTKNQELQQQPKEIQDAAALMQDLGKLDPNDPNKKILENQLYNTFSKLLDINKKANLAQANGDESKIDPLYQSKYSATAPYYLRYQTLPPKDEFAKQLLQDHPEIQQLIQDRQAYFANNPIPQKPGAIAYNQGPQPSPYVQQQLTAKNFNDPQVKTFLDDRTKFDNQKLQQLNLSPVNSFGQLPFQEAKYQQQSAQRQASAGLRRAKQMFSKNKLQGVSKQSKTVSFGKTSKAPSMKTISLKGKALNLKV